MEKDRKRDRSKPPLAGAVGKLAERQHGVVSRTQLLEIGLSDGQIVRWVENERLRTIRRGVYSLGPLSGGRDAILMSAVLLCGPGSVLSHRSAAALWGFRGWTGPVEVLSTVTGRRRGARGGSSRLPLPRVRKVSRLDSREFTLVRGIPVTTVARTFVDLAEVLGRKQVEGALREASIAGKLDLEDLRRAVAAGRGRNGIRTLRAVLERHHPLTVLTRSQLEARFLTFLRKNAFPAPRVNAMVASCEVDFYWPEYELIVELDGRRYHDDARGFEQDRERTAWLELSGRRVLRLTWEMVVNQPAATEAKLRAYVRMAHGNKMDAERIERIRAKNRARSDSGHVERPGSQT